MTVYLWTFFSNHVHPIHKCFAVKHRVLPTISNSHSIIQRSVNDDLLVQFTATLVKISKLLHFMHSCIGGIKALATHNTLELNDNMIELILVTSIGTKHRHSLPTAITIGNAQILFKSLSKMRLYL